MSYPEPEYNPQDNTFTFFSEDKTRGVSIDAQILARLALKHMDEKTIIRALNERGYRVQELKVGRFFDMWETVY